MRKPIFDYTDGDFIFNNGSGNIAFDSQGNMMMRMSSSMSMDMDDGEVHLTSDWSSEDDEY